MPLLEIWESSSLSVLDMTIEQILPMAGDGKLKDGSECADELREFLTQVDRQTLKTYAHHCLEHSFGGSGFVLQDIVNEVGRRFGLDVTHGLFRGRRNQNNADGLWRGADWTFIVEVKTTDAYSINLDTIADYQTAYSLTDGAQPSSCLIVVGRQDTATLEDQLRGSRHNWEMRIVGVQALFEALELKEMSEDPTLGEKLIGLLKPREFTRVDEILSAALDFATDRELATDINLEETEAEPRNNKVSNAEHTLRPYMSDKEQVEQLKAKIARRLEEKFSITLIRTRSLLESSAKGFRFAVAVSRFHKQRDTYWYGYRPHHMEYLADSKNSFFVVGFLDIGRAFAVPVDIMNSLKTNMNVTVPEGDEAKTIYHVHIGQQGDRSYIYTQLNQQQHDITCYEI